MPRTQNNIILEKLQMLIGKPNILYSKYAQCIPTTVKTYSAK